MVAWISSVIRFFLSVMALCLLASASNVSAAATAATAMLSVERSAFVLRQTNGEVLQGVQLQGLVIRVPLGASGTVRDVRLASITPNPDDAEILRHEFQVRNADGRWRAACEPTADGETWGVAVVSAHDGKTASLTCASGAIAKCMRFGYKPWGRGAHGEDLGPYHQACIHMVRADYAGDGTPRTKPGTYIQYHDGAVNLNRAVPGKGDPDYVFEAGWSADGAVCVAHVRWAELGALDDIVAASPRLSQIAPAACTESTAAARGALIFSSSRLQPRIGR